jgi:hypothetical protein
MKRAIGALAFCCLVWVALPAAGHDMEIHTRNLEAHYGTVHAIDPDGNPLGDRSFLELTDHVTATLRNRIFFEPGRDSRVTSMINNWVDNSVTDDIEWIFSTPEGLDAADNLFNDLESFAGLTVAITSDTGSMDRGTQGYEIGFWVTSNCVTSTCDGSGDLNLIDHTAIAYVHYYERNIEKVVSPPVAAPALSLRALATLFVALLAFGARGLRTRRRSRHGSHETYGT